MSKKIYFQYTPPAKTAWDELPMSEKADIMKSCVRNGIYSEKGQRVLEQERAIDNLYKRKVEEVLYPDASKDSEMWIPSELTAHTFGIGKSLGLKPFQEYPGPNKAIKLIKKARKEDSYLWDIKAGTEEEIKNFWKLLTGNYMPATIGGISSISFTIPNKTTK